MKRKKTGKYFATGHVTENFDFKGVICPFGINIWIEIHLFLLIGK